MSAVDLTRDERAVRQTSGPVLGMVVFVASEAMFFATFFGAYFTIYSVNPVWPPAGFPRLEPELATVLTVVLVSSSVTLQLGVRAIRRDRARLLLRRPVGREQVAPGPQPEPPQRRADGQGHHGEQR